MTRPTWNCCSPNSRTHRTSAGQPSSFVLPRSLRLPAPSEWCGASGAVPWYGNRVVGTDSAMTRFLFPRGRLVPRPNSHRPRRMNTRTALARCVRSCPISARCSDSESSGAVRCGDARTNRRSPRQTPTERDRADGSGRDPEFLDQSRHVAGGFHVVARRGDGSLRIHNERGPDDALDDLAVVVLLAEGSPSP